MLEFLRRNFRWVAGGFILTYFSGFGQTFFISASVAEWQSVFGLSHGEFGRLYMFATLASALCLPFVGRVVDLVPPHRIILVVIPVLAGAALLAGYASSLPLLILAVFLLRLVGQGMLTHIALTTTARWFVAERGRAISLVVLGHQGGEATILLGFAALTIAYGFRTGWIAAAVLLLVIGLPVAYWCYQLPRVPHGRTSTEKSSAPAVRSWTRREVLRDPVFWVLLTGVLAPPFIGTTIFYHQNYLTTLHGWPPQIFAFSLIIMALTTIGCALLTGAAIDRFRATVVLPFFLLPIAAACFVLASSGPETTLYIAMVLLGISSGISSTLFGSLWPEIYGLDHLGAIRSVTVAAVVLATAAGPGLTGTLIDWGMDLPAQMTFFGAYCLIGSAAVTLASLSLRRRA
ncbi:MAG: MFS transporter [Woeseiaceae bacterium]